MYLTGFADEAGVDVNVQIAVTQQLGWENIEMRAVSVNSGSIGMLHDIPEAEFELVAERLDAASVRVNCFGSAIANWAHSIEDPFEITLEKVRRTIPRMQRMKSSLIRIMSYKVREEEDQMEQERFRRLREIRQMFVDAGITPVHENCNNYGGMGWQFTLKLLENVPGLLLVFDTGNPVFSDDRGKPKPWPKQSSWEFYQHVREHIAYIHIKDGYWDARQQKSVFTFPGEGQGDTRRIVRDLMARGYDGGISIEPHMGSVFHEPEKGRSLDAVGIYVEYGRRMEQMISELRAELQSEARAADPHDGGAQP